MTSIPTTIIGTADGTTTTSTTTTATTSPSSSSTNNTDTVSSTSSINSNDQQVKRMPMKLVKNVGRLDVLFGRGTGPSNRVGNVAFRALVKKHNDEYVDAIIHGTKTSVARMVIDEIHAKKGHFLRKLERNEIQRFSAKTDHDGLFVVAGEGGDTGSETHDGSETHTHTHSDTYTDAVEDPTVAEADSPQPSKKKIDFSAELYVIITDMDLIIQKTKQAFRHVNRKFDDEGRFANTKMTADHHHQDADYSATNSPFSKSEGKGAAPVLTRDSLIEELLLQQRQECQLNEQAEQQRQLRELHLQNQLSVVAAAADRQSISNLRQTPMITHQDLQQHQCKYHLPLSTLVGQRSFPTTAGLLLDDQRRLLQSQAFLLSSTGYSGDPHLAASPLDLMALQSAQQQRHSLEQRQRLFAAKISLLKDEARAQQYLAASRIHQLQEKAKVQMLTQTLLSQQPQQAHSIDRHRLLLLAQNDMSLDDSVPPPTTSLFQGP